jgi:hypothetical protein
MRRPAAIRDWNQRSDRSEDFCMDQTVDAGSSLGRHIRKEVLVLHVVGWACSS